MLILFDSKTGNVERFIDSLELAPTATLRLSKDLCVAEPFVLVTYTTGFGEVPAATSSFLENNHSYLKGVATSGNKIWGANYGKSADAISKQYQVPIVHKFELSGMPADRSLFLERVEELTHETH